ncbi:hypothetical protein ACWD6I_12925 [Streptomyces sp. NPDC002454]
MRHARTRLRPRDALVRYAGVLVIVMISGACGLVIGMALGTA